MAATDHIEFWFEFASTYSYPAALRVEAAAAARGIPIVWRPFLLGPIFHDVGWDDSPFNIYPAKGRYMWRDLERLCAVYGFDFRRPSKFPRGSLLAARLACRFDAESWVPEFVRRVYRANFVEDLDIGQAEVIGSILRSLALPENLLAEAQTGEAKGKLRAQTERAVALGIFGAPTCVVGEELFWGNDRIEAALDWFARGRAK
jgi:2-hydroxychromene-2-carboxylate isomerase